ncbi:hypothetical protein [Corynebacterium sp.]|uniref:hypothetical protein n=1 Tax=Corynebacterium sp. TaxID=1720 RepID=UPI0027B891E4|nr:hypothetical protein [Corynebacterium sp.]
MTNYRKFAVTGVSAAALALAACTPPNENPSDQKVETGSTFEAPRTNESNSTETTETGVAGTTATNGTGTDGTGQSVQTTETVIGGSDSELDDDDEDAELATASGDSATGSSGAVKTARKRAQRAKRVGFINCLGTPERKPSFIVLDCGDPTLRLEKLEWESWGTDSAKATAQRVSHSTTGSKNSKDSSPQDTVTVTLRSPVESAQGVVFSEIWVDNQLITP